jgi:predicted negative regulator of RcsB-dependent stress response
MLACPRFSTFGGGQIMQQQESEALDAQLRDKVWTFAQRVVVALVVFGAGVLLGYRLWGQAGQLQEQVEELTERTQALVKERDTERSRVTLIERDKKELERQLEDSSARIAAAEAQLAAAKEEAPPEDVDSPAEAPAEGGS